MKRFLSLIYIFLICLGAAGLAEDFSLPECIAHVESEAFSGLPAGSAFLYPALADIAPDAFGPEVTTILGVAGSAAERFARDTGREFVDIGISFQEPVMPEWISPSDPLHISVKAESRSDLRFFRVQLEKDGAPVLTSAWSISPNFTLDLPCSGELDVRVQASNESIMQEKLFPALLTVAEPVHFADAALRVNVGESLQLLSADETRPVSFAIDRPECAALDGACVRGLKAGKCLITATAAQPEGLVTTKITLDVCVPVTAVKVKAPASYLFVGSSAQLTASAAPANATYPAATYVSSDPSIISVTADGRMTAHALGSAVITATADGVSASVEIRAVYKPTAVRIEKQDPEAGLYTKSKTQYIAVFSPEGAYSENLAWSVESAYYATVNSSGLVSCLRAGKTKLTCSVRDVPGLSVTRAIEVIQAPDTISLSASSKNVYMGKPLALKASFTPGNVAAGTLTWTSSDPAIATVNERGQVSAAGQPGVVTITATAVNGVRAAITLRVYDQAAPESFTLSKTALYIEKGEVYTFSNFVKPAGAIADATWSSSNPGIARVDQSGVVTAVTYGTTRITAVSKVDASISSSCVLTVLNPNRTLAIPLRRTDESGIAANLQRIAALKTSAYDELNALCAAGKISSKVMNARKTVIDRAFSMYAFPWMTPELQKYWKAANSENGAKDFKPGIVYYGLPYISGTYYSQRLYSATKALSEKRYTVEGDHYLLNRKNLLGGTYCGNDCSGFVGLSYFGDATATSRGWRTNHFAETTEFVTLSKSAELYPGDVLVRSYSHIVMFLYYANPEHTQFVILEQGGSEAGINTVNASVYNTSYFLGNGYIPRRYSTW